MNLKFSNSRFRCGKGVCSVKTRFNDKVCLAANSVVVCFCPLPGKYILLEHSPSLQTRQYIFYFFCPVNVQWSFSPVPCYFWACAVVSWARAVVSWLLWAQLPFGPTADAVLLLSCRGRQSANIKAIILIFLFPQMFLFLILNKRCLIKAHYCKLHKCFWWIKARCIVY